MAIALGEAVALALVDAVVQFAIHGNEKEMQERLLLPSLEAKIWFKDDWIEGHHQGLRALCGRQGSFWCIGPRCYSVEASGHGTFVSEELIYTGIFVNNKLHDLTGNATCSFGSTVRYAGCFEHGHYSGQGTLSQMFNGQWIVTFEGSWKLSKPWCGNYLDISGNVMSTVMDGVIIRLGPEPVGGAAPPADASPANNSRHDANAGKPSPSADQSAGEAGEATAKPKSPAPPQSPSRGTRVHPMPDTAGSSMPTAATAQVAAAVDGSENNGKNAHNVDGLIQRKLANPQLHLSLEDSLTVVRHCVELGRVNAERISGKTAIVVVGNTGAGKSTFLNYLAGCSMASKSKREVGLKGRGDVVVVKPVFEGGRRDELVKIGHGRISQTFLPNVIFDDETELCFCDCPGFLDNRGAEINIANAVNLITTLSNAKEVKVIILLSYDSIKADRGRGLSDLITVCIKLFGSVDKLKQHISSVLIGCSLFDADGTLEELQEELMDDAPSIMGDLVQRLFLVDVLTSRKGWWDREECIQQIAALRAIANPADVFHTVLLASDEQKLVAIGLEMNRRVEDSLRKAEYVKCHELYGTLRLLSVIKHIAVERMVHDCYLTICKHFMREAFAMKEHCHLSAFAEAEQVLQNLQAAAAVFHGQDWAEVVPLEQLVSFYSRAQIRHTEQVQRDQALQLQLQQAGNQIDLLTAALEATNQEALRKEKEHLERFDTMRTELAQELERAQALFLASQQTLREEMTARLLAKDEETQLAMELRQQDVIARLDAEKDAIREEYRQLLEASERKYAAERARLEKREHISLLDQQRTLDIARKEVDNATKRICDLQAQKEIEQAVIAQQHVLECELAETAVPQEAVDGAHHKEREQEAQNLKEEEIRLPVAAAVERNEAYKNAPVVPAAAPAAAVEPIQRPVTAKLVSSINLLSIAESNDATLLKKLDGVGALGTLSDINQVHAYYPPPGRFVTNMTALMIASCLGHTAVVQLLLKVPAVNVNLQDDQDGWTALTFACHAGHIAVVKTLLADVRVAVNIKHRNGSTALMWAIREGHIAIVQALLADTTVDATIKDNHGKTALDWALKVKRTAIIPLLKAKEGKWRLRLWWGK